MKPEQRAGMLRRTARSPVRALLKAMLELNPEPARASSSNTAYSSRLGV
jgi:hypothetical protein